MLVQVVILLLVNAVQPGISQHLEHEYARPPSVFASDPDVGSPGTLVGLAGANFKDTTECRFGSHAASVAFYTGSNRVYCKAPPHAGYGKVNVTCSNDGTVFSKPNTYATFTYVRRSPQQKESTAPPVFQIALDAPPRERWKAPVKALVTKYGFNNSFGAMTNGFWDTLPKVAQDALLEIANISKPVMPFDFVEEIQGIVDQFDGMGYGDVVSFPMLLSMNLLYDITTACTSIVAQDEKGGLWHGRNLDFPFLSLKNVTATVEFQRKNKTIATGTTFVGFVGLFTAKRGKHFSVTMDGRYTGGSGMKGIVAAVERLVQNMRRLWRFHAAPNTYVLRDVATSPLSTTYARALQSLQLTPVATEAYFIVPVKILRNTRLTMCTLHSHDPVTHYYRVLLCVVMTGRVRRRAKER